MSSKSARKAIGCLVVWRVISAAPTAAETAASAVLERSLYLASVAAAESSLRLHETEAAGRWLELAPAAQRGWEWHYLARRLDDSSLAIAAHQESASGIDLSPDGRTVATCSVDGSVRLWKGLDGERLQTLTGHGAAVWNARFSPDGRLLASASSDGTIRIWSVDRGVELRRIEAVGRGISSVAWSPDGLRLASGSWKRSDETGVYGLIQVWDAATGQNLHSLVHGVKPIPAVAWSPDGRLVAAGTWDDDIALVEAATGRLHARLVPPPDAAYKAVQALAFSRDSTRVAVGAKDGTVRIWDLASASLVATYTGQAEGASRWINGVAFVGAGWVASAGADATLRLRDLEDGKEVAVFHGAQRPLTALVASSQGDRLLTTDSSGTWRSWDLSALARASPTWRLSQQPYSLAFRPNGEQAATASWGGEIALLDSASGAPVRAWPGHEQAGVAAAWSANDEYLVTGGNDGAVVLWRPATGERLRELARADRQVTSVAISSDSRFVAAPASGGRVEIHEVPGGELRATLIPEGETEFRSVAWSPDGQFLAVGGSAGDAWLWEWRQKMEARRLPHGTGRVAVAFSAIGSWLATGSSTGSLALWDATDGRLRARLAGHTQSIDAMAFSPDGTRLASGGGDDTLRLWDPRSGDQVLALPIGAPVWALAWSPDGDRLGLVVLDRSIRLLSALPAHPPH